MYSIILIFLLRGQGGGLGLWATTWNLNQQEGKWCWLLIQRVASRRDAQNERDGAGLRCSVTAATPSQQRLRRSSVAAALRAPWAVDGALGRAAPRENLPLFDRDIIKLSLFRINIQKELRSLPWPGEVNFFYHFGGVKKSCVWVVTHRIDVFDNFILTQTAISMDY